MFVSINWIKEYVDLSGLDIKKLIESFTLATAEVEDIIVKGEDIQNVVVGEILSIENHPNSKKLHLLKVDLDACGKSANRAGGDLVHELRLEREGLLSDPEFSVRRVVVHDGTDVPYREPLSFSPSPECR